ncbi:MAG: beta-ketoacyl-ACP synthase II [Rhodothermales bacterium]
MTDQQHGISRQRVVVTGLGALTPIGLSPDAFWEGMMRGESGAAPITYFDTSNFSTRFACELKAYDPKEYMDRKQARRLDPFCQYALSVARQAMDDAGLDTANLAMEEQARFGVIFGAGFGGLNLFQSQTKTYLDHGPRRLSPFFVPMMISNMAAGLIAKEYGLRGPNHCVVSACATGNHNIGDALLLLRHGYADAILCGGTEACITELGIGGFAAMKALSTRNDSPETASRPFDKTRDGFVAGEGAGALVLETLEHAQARGTDIYAEVIGIGSSADAYHFAAPDPEGHGVMFALQRALADAGLQPEDVDYINMHATATPLGDVAETEAIKKVFGEHAYRMSLSGTKSMTGHLLGAAAAIEAVATVLAVKHGKVPPTINYQEPDPDCDLDYTVSGPKERSMRVALSNAFGFGGHNTSVVFKRFES